MTTPRPTTSEEWIERMRLAMRGTLPAELGVEVLHVGAGEARGRMAVTAKHLHPGGYAHSAATACLADTVAAWATLPLLDPGEAFSTIEFKSNFFAPVNGGMLICEASALHRGKRTVVLRSDVVDREGKPVALMIVTQQVLEGDPGA